MATLASQAVSNMGGDVLLNAAVGLQPYLRQRAAETEQLGRVSTEITEKLKAAGLMRICQPTEHGGYALPPSAAFKILFELARACPSTAWCCMVANSTAWFASYWPQSVQAQVWRETEDALLAMSGVPLGKGRRVQAGYEIWGSWPWASNCDNSDWAIVSAPIADVEGGVPETQWLLVPMSELSIDQESWDMAGMRGSGSKTLVREQPLFVPEEARVKLSQISNDDAPGASIAGNLMASYNFTTLSGVMLLGPVLGMAQGALDIFVESMKLKVKTSIKAGATTTVSENPFAQARAGDAASRIEAAVALLMRDVEGFEAQVATGEKPSATARIAIRRDIGFGARQACDAVNVLAEAVGASSFAMRADFQRHWRDLSVAVRHVTLDTDAIFTMAGQQMFGLPPIGSF